MSTRFSLPNAQIALIKAETDPWVAPLHWYGMVHNDVSMMLQTEGFNPIPVSGLATNDVAYAKSTTRPRRAPHGTCHAAPL